MLWDSQTSICLIVPASGSHRLQPGTGGGTLCGLTPLIFTVTNHPEVRHDSLQLVALGQQRQECG